jgi:uncharacterized protein (DUF2164 family)
MEIKLSKDTEQRLLPKIQRYCSDSLGQEVGELQASLFLRFCVEEIGPSIYNQAIADAQGFLQEKLADLENTCFVEEPGPGVRRAAPKAGRRPAGFRP